ncbi:BN159_2729 family protein [Streptomyces sp. 5-8]|uniref:BN159_2729 family protein n=1 Tax=Streptomyces musisoli TaxID=2802280 RepID=A0ABS1P6Q0_9ACTN|nr:BN159_2729 family protein [Streptomyces musisoli]MBL1108031.1 BN159_2729 family protein [Streptomyces musisoli]
MNRNLSHALRVIRATMATDSTDPAAAIAHALDGVGLLIDPERSYGPVLGREAPVDQELTELEQQALAWDAACERSRRVAAIIEQGIGERAEFKTVRTDGDRILIALHITDQAQWAAWRQYFGISYDQERPLPYAVAGEGYRDGVRVSVVAYDLPQVRTAAAERADRPYELDGIVYDLSRPQRDAHGDVWYFQGQRAEDGMPLLSLDGRSERCSLANIATQTGPLTPVITTPSTQVTPVSGKGGEAA